MLGCSRVRQPEGPSLAMIRVVAVGAQYKGKLHELK